MGFKVKKTNFISETGLQDSDVISEIEFGGFNNATKEIITQWKVTSSSGKVIGVFPQKVPLASLNITLIEKLVEFSDLLHELGIDVPCFPTPEGLKSFADFNAETIDVGMPTIE